MITRAQAEALLTLAESLEACEQLDLHLYVPGRGEITLVVSQDHHNLDLNSACEVSPNKIRFAVLARLDGVET